MAWTTTQLSAGEQCCKVNKACSKGFFTRKANLLSFLMKKRKFSKDHFSQKVRETDRSPSAQENSATTHLTWTIVDIWPTTTYLILSTQSLNDPHGKIFKKKHFTNTAAQWSWRAVQKQYYEMPEFVEFQTMGILVPYGITFDALGVFGLAFHLLFKSCSTYCARQGNVLCRDRHMNNSSNVTYFQPCHWQPY